MKSSGVLKGTGRFLLLVVYLLILLEGAARLSFMVPALSAKLQEDEDATWRRWWMDRHGEGVEVYYTFDIYDPSKGWGSKPLVRDMGVFDDKFLNTNSKGLRGKREYSYDRVPGRTRVLIIGDSFTFGDEVSDNETFSHYLQEMMPAVEIINMGVHGYGHDQMLILLKEEGVKYRPDIVILGFLPLDMSRNVLQFRDYAKPRFVIGNDGLTLTGSPVPHPEDILRWDWLRPRLYDVWSSLRHKAMVSGGQYEKLLNEVTALLLEELASVIKSAGAVAVFAYLPTSHELSDQSTVTAGEEFLFSICKETGVTHCFSLRSAFILNTTQGEQFNPTGHWNPRGHLTAAETIRAYLTEQDLVPLP